MDARARWTPGFAEFVTRDLAGYSLENVAAWLEIEVTDRHSALGDALAAARVFLALLPWLREIGIRTLAKPNGRATAHRRTRQRAAPRRWVEPNSGSGAFDAGQASMRVDSYPTATA